MRKETRREFLKKTGLGAALISLAESSSVAAQTGGSKKNGLPKGAEAMEYVRKVDFAAIAKSGANERYTQNLFDQASGAKTCTINCIKTPPGGGSPAGLHVHEVDQIFYIISGVMAVEIEGRQHDCPPGSLVIFPARVPHRNWNRGTEATVHLAIQIPIPDPKVPFAKPA
ncbi:MAG TPA: cupin domain-containing protein [Thermodesulfobacteriota bacterium]|nr:cupin domain-containing protein [Thermodesulfobacteriota bacterium]